jgi:hypothetical protein
VRPAVLHFDLERDFYSGLNATLMGTVRKVGESVEMTEYQTFVFGALYETKSFIRADCLYKSLHTNPPLCADEAAKH